MQTLSTEVYIIIVTKADWNVMPSSTFLDGWHASQFDFNKAIRTIAKVDVTKMKAPAFKMVLTAVGDYAYQRKDGVLVVPIGCLKD